MHPMLDVITDLSNLSPIPAIALGWKKRGILWYYVGLCALCDALTCALRYYRVKHDLVSNFFIVAQFLLVAMYLCQGIFNKKQQIAIITPFVVFFIMHTVICAPHEVNFIGASGLYSPLIVICMVSLFFVMRDIEHIKIEHSSRFIVSAGFFIYTSGSLFILIYYIYFDKKYPLLLDKLWGLHDFLNILKNLAIARFFTLTIKQPYIAT